MLHKVAVLAVALVLAALAAPAANFTTRGATTGNDNSCDIAVTPAATLLLPYFEVDKLRTTLFTVINVSPQPQIARVTLWTDWAFPAYSFDLYLTGYGVESVNLRDVFAGAVPSTPADAMPGDRSQSANPNHLPSMPVDCAQRPAAVPPAMLADLQQMFTTGHVSACGATRVGSPHESAIGYATIDVVATCSPLNPSSPDYYSTDLLFDNVLLGDYEEVSATASGDATGYPMVHIRAIPEGGAAGSYVATNLPFTFYDRMTTRAGGYARTADRRQPLPTTFALRCVQSENVSTRVQIWREALTGTAPRCDDYARNRNQPILDPVRFDEHENSFIFAAGLIILPPPSPPGTPVAFRPSTSSSLFPQNSGTTDIGGWLYLNLDNLGSSAYSVTINGKGRGTFRTPERAASRGSQNWVSLSMALDGRSQAGFDAVPLANGCSVTPSTGAQIGPGANVTP
ncbi:MAG: hypothetical protein JWO97_2533 [Acidobacteria bacterium]|nr:hypothetical protein [Acidobacteriota bacterium]